MYAFVFNPPNKHLKNNGKNKPLQLLLSPELRSMNNVGLIL